MAAAGGGVYYGVHALLTPSIYGTSAANIPKRSWMLPLGGIIGGHALTMIPKVAAVGLGLVGGATAIGIEQVQMGISIKKNAAASGAAAQTNGVGALLEPGDIRQQLSSGTGVVEEDAGALWSPANYRVSEAAGLSL
jgi:hypothetical protein